MVAPVQPPQPELQFPLKWCYRAVVPADDAACHAGLNAVLQQFGFRETFTAANASSGGRYRSYHVEVELPDKKTLDSLGDALSKVPGVKFLL